MFSKSFAGILALTSIALTSATPVPFVVNRGETLSSAAPASSAALTSSEAPKPSTSAAANCIDTWTQCNSKYQGVPGDYKCGEEFMKCVAAETSKNPSASVPLTSSGVPSATAPSSSSSVSSSSLASKSSSPAYSSPPTPSGSSPAVSSGSPIGSGSSIPGSTAASSSGSPTTSSSGPSPTGVSGSITAQQLTQIAPKLASCNSSALFADECRTAEQAAPFVNKAFEKYDITSTGEKAAILSLELFESGNFSFDKNHFPEPGRPGQGTRNLMMFPFVYQYAVDTEETKEKALALVPDVSASQSASNETMNAVRELVLGDELSFASGAWFYKASGDDKKGCASKDGVVSGLQTESVEGWTAFITECVGTTVTPDRQSLWEATLKALKGQ